VERYNDLDVAVLHLSEDMAGGFAVGRAVEEESWQVEAQPRGNDPKLTGTINATQWSLVTQSGYEISVLQLQVDQILDDYKGYSGSPVTLKSPTSAVIGILIEQLRSRLSLPTGQARPATNVLYAIPIQEVLNRFGLVREPLQNELRNFVETAQWNVDQAYDLLDPEVDISPADKAKAVRSLETAKMDIEHLKELLQENPSHPKYGSIIDQVDIIIDQVNRYLLPYISPSASKHENFQQRFTALKNALIKLDTLIPQ